MKKFYTMLALLGTAFAASAQVTVTLSVDMQNQTVAAEGVHVAGSFQGWDPAATEMTDADMDGVYEYSFTTDTAATYEFKFVNGNAWGMDEGVPGPCAVNNNRAITVDPATGDAAYAVCYGECAACGEITVMFRVDMSQEEAISPNGVHIAGDFQGWMPGDTPMSDDDGDLVYTYTTTIDTTGTGGVIGYKYINGNGWTDPQDMLVGAECADGGGNRLLEITGSTIVTGVEETGAPHCFSSCGSCVAPTMVTFRVDMSTQDVISENGVCIAGSFQGWSPGVDMLSDDDGDLIYEATLALVPGTYQYKFINGTDWGGGGAGDVDNELITGDCAAAGSDNREIIVGTEAMEVLYCYNSCSSDCVANPDPADITFRVDMTNESVSADGVYLMGSFTSPAWQSGAVMMTDDDMDMVYEATLNISGSADIFYKFVNGVPNGEGALEESGILVVGTDTTTFETAGCGVPNGFGEYNRKHTRSGVAEVLGAVCWNSCLNCSGEPADVADLTAGALLAYPNPFEDQFIVEVNAVAETAAIQLVDMMGRVVLSQNVQGAANARIELNTSTVAPGVYALELLAGERRTVMAVVKH